MPVAEVRTGDGESRRHSTGRSGPSSTRKASRSWSSRAAKLRVVLDGAKTSRLPQMVAAADRRVEQVEAERRAFLAGNAPTLARRDREQRVAACERIKAKASDLLADVAEVQGGYHVLVELVAAVPGSALDGRSIQTDPQVDELERVLSSLGTLTPPRIPAFTPYVGEDDPGAYLTADGGWIRTRSPHQSDAGLADLQPERVARPE